jgi:hypothetical protein
LGDDPASFCTAFRSQIDDVIGASNEVKVVFDHHQGVALRKEFLESGEEKLDIGHVETRGGLVEDEEGFPFLALGNVLGQFEPL